MGCSVVANSSTMLQYVKSVTSMVSGLMVQGPMLSCMAACFNITSSAEL